MKPATPKLWDLRAKLKALVERGVNGERLAAEAKLKRLESRVDFSKPDVRGPDLFAGRFVPASDAAPVLRFEVADFDIANAVKWAIEGTTGIRCLFHVECLMARAHPTTANRLHDIAATIAANMGQLWQQYSRTPQATPLDRQNFIGGLLDGMLNDVRTGEALPRRAIPAGKPKRARKGAVGQVAGLNLHPYSVGANLGASIRHCVPLVEIAGELERTVKGELQEVTL